MENPYFIKQKIGSNGEDLSLVQDENITKVTYSHGTTMEQIIVNKKGKVLDSLVGKMNSEGIELFHVDYVPENLKKYEREVKHLATIQNHLINVYNENQKLIAQRIQEYVKSISDKEFDNIHDKILPHNYSFIEKDDSSKRKDVSSKEDDFYTRKLYLNKLLEQQKKDSQVKKTEQEVQEAELNPYAVN
jgi:hypothetical protein